MADKRISSAGGRIPSRNIGGVAAVPANIVGPLRRFWDFTKKTAKSFAKNLNNTEQKEDEFTKAVEKDSRGW
ncbi:hypothetical protein HZC34_05155 [Candidatus Saganbacteria bacterium]|nr:hypothetical protein [Candidatus Saganbacteria bacterium]